MTADSYKGESAGKKWARWMFWSACKAYFEDIGRVDHFVSGRHVFFASREGGDYGVLRALGARWSSMFGVEVNDEAARECHEKWRDVIDDPVESPVLQMGDVNTEIDFVGAPIRSCFLDFCGHIGAETLMTCVNIFRSMPIGSIFAAAFLKGREKRHGAKMVANVGNRHRRRVLARGSSGANRQLIAGLHGSVPLDVNSLISSFAEEEGGSAHFKTGGRWALLTRALEAASTYRSPNPMMIVEYHSRSPGSAGVPMIIMAFVVAHKGAVMTAPIYCKAPKDAASWVRSEAVSMGSQRGAMAMNVPRSTVTAWLAVGNRGRKRNAAQPMASAEVGEMAQ